MEDEYEGYEKIANNKRLMIVYHPGYTEHLNVVEADFSDIKVNYITHEDFSRMVMCKTKDGKNIYINLSYLVSPAEVAELEKWDNMP